MHNFNINDIN